MAKNPYHNATHAADVLFGTFWCLLFHSAAVELQEVTKQHPILVAKSKRVLHQNSICIAMNFFGEKNEDRKLIVPMGGVGVGTTSKLACIRFEPMLGPRSCGAAKVTP